MFRGRRMHHSPQHQRQLRQLWFALLDRHHLYGQPMGWLLLYQYLFAWTDSVWLDLRQHCFRLFQLRIVWYNLLFSQHRIARFM